MDTTNYWTQTESIVYQAVCNTCQESGPSSRPQGEEVVPVSERKPGTVAVYTGESCRSVFVRGKQHLSAIENPENHPDNAFVKHSTQYHAGEEPSFKLSVTGSFPKPLERQIWEGVLIRRSEQEADIVMNSKLDHYAPAVGKVVISNAVGDS